MLPIAYYILILLSVLYLGYLLLDRGHRLEPVWRWFSRCFPKNALFHYLLGETLSKKTGREQEAEAELRTAIRLDPKQIQAYSELVQLVMKKDNWLPEGETLCNQMFEILPHNPVAYFVRGRIFQERKQFPEAEQAFRDLIAMSPKYTFGYEHLGALFIQQNRLDEAAKMYEKAISIQPNNGQLHRDYFFSPGKIGPFC